MKLRKKILATLLSVSMLFTMTGASAVFAAEGDSSTTSSGVELSKTVTLEDDGTYTIDLEAYATGEVSTTIETKTEGVPCDIVLVLDQSRSMGDSLGTTNTYTARNSQAYTYKGYTSTYYYKDADGKYYEVSKGEGGNCNNKYYYLSYKKNGTTYYLSGTTVTTVEPTNIKNDSTTIWSGVLYTVKSESITKQSALKNAVTTFVTAVQQNAATNNVDHKVAIVGFASDSNVYNNFTNTELLSTSSVVAASNVTDTLGITAANYRSALVSANVSNAVNSRLTTAISRIDANGATAADSGLKLAKNVINNRTETTYTKQDGTTANRKTIVVFFTDGYPGTNATTNFSNNSSYKNIDTANRAIAVADSIKATNNTVIYSVGVLKGADPSANYNFTVSNDGSTYSTGAQAANAFLHFVSSDFKSAVNMITPNRKTVVNNGYYLAADNAAALENVFETITSSIETSTSSSSCVLDSNSVLRDIIADEFDGSAATITSVKTAEYKGDDNWASPVAFNATTSTDGTAFDVKGFSYKDNYVAEKTTGKAATGKKLMVTIKGVLPKDAAVTGEAIATNSAKSGIYANAEAAEPAAVFPQPKTILTETAYVIDYAKEASLDISKVALTPITGIVDQFKAVTSNAAMSATGTYGNTTWTGSALSYTPTTMAWSGYDSVYALGKTTDSAITSVDANKTTNVWTKVSMIPANNVYYEDSFESTDGVAGIVYGGAWEVLGEDDGNTEVADDGIQGWTETLADDMGDTDGSSHMATASASNKATATFTFAGTGLDIYGRTTPDNGSIMVTVKGTADDGSAVSKVQMIDTVSTSGEYYAVPTVSFANLPHGTYEATVRVTTSAKTRFIYYIDGIRIYNPIVEDDVVADAYGEEAGAEFTTMRDMLMTYGTVEGTNKVVFIDDVDGSKASVDYDDDSDTFKTYGPKNEVYLAPGQGLSLQVKPGLNYSVGIRAINEVSTVEYSNGEGKTVKTIESAADQYYKITPNAQGIAYITNTGSGIISVTKLKITGGASGASTYAILEPDVPAIEAYANSFAMLSLVDNVVAEQPAENNNDVVIENPTEEVVETPSNNWTNNLFGGIKKIFGR